MHVIFKNNWYAPDGRFIYKDGKRSVEIDDKYRNALPKSATVVEEPSEPKPIIQVADASMGDIARANAAELAKVTAKYQEQSDRDDAARLALADKAAAEKKEADRIRMAKVRAKIGKKNQKA